MFTSLKFPPFYARPRPVPKRKKEITGKSKYSPWLTIATQRAALDRKSIKTKKRWNVNNALESPLYPFLVDTQQLNSHSTIVLHLST
jgi:hypothetical protein